MWMKQVYPAVRPAITDSKGNGYLFNPSALHIFIPGKLTGWFAR
jgi:hypothetical protein